MQLAHSGIEVWLYLIGQLGLGTNNLTVNQQNITTTLNDFFSDGGVLPPEFVTLFGLTGDALPNALAQFPARAELRRRTERFWGLFYNFVFDPFAQNRSGLSSAPTAFAPGAAHGLKDLPISRAPARMDLDAPRWSLWGGNYGGTATTSGNATTGSHDTTTRAYGFVVGANHWLSPNTLIGFALAGGETRFRLDGGPGGGTSDLVQASAYARHLWGPMGALGYGWQDFSLDRTVAISGTDKLEADLSAHTVAGRAEGGYRLGTPLAAITPYGALQVVSLDLPSYTKHAKFGSEAFALTYAGRTDTQTRTELGARFDIAMTLETSLLTLRGWAAWVHNFDTARAADARFLALPDTDLTVHGARPDADAFLVSAGAELELASGFSIAEASRANSRTIPRATQERRLRAFAGKEMDAT